MARLDEIARIIRSKNAGPFLVTLDVLFDETETFDAAVASGCLSEDNVRRVYGPEADVLAIHAHRAAKGIKIVLKRQHSAGSFLDNDLYGAQQHVPLYDIEVDAIAPASG